MEDINDDRYNSTSDDGENSLDPLDGTNVPECEGIPRRSWVGLCVVLYRNDGHPIAKCICCNVSSNHVVGTSGPLGDTHVVVQVSFSLSEEDVPDDWRYSNRAWPIEFVYFNGSSFRDHELCATFLEKVALRKKGLTLNKFRTYKSSIRNRPCSRSTKAKKVLQQHKINVVASKDCCSRNCTQTFSREKIKLLRERI